MFGVIIPGYPFRTDFIQLNETCWYIDIPAPAGINEIAFSLLQPLTNEFVGVGIYCAPMGNTETFYYLGAVANGKMSTLIYTSWGFNENLVNVEFMRVYAQIKDIGELEQANETSKNGDSRTNFAFKIANNLHMYIESFDYRTPEGHLIVPQGLVEKWFEKF